jgi:hypothetical protein
LPILILATAILSSCATAFNGRDHKMVIRTNSPAKEIIINNKNFLLQDGEVKLRVERNKKHLQIEIQNGDSLQQINIKSHNSFTYVYFTVATAGINALIERKNPKRYFYSKNIYLEQKDGIIKVLRFPPVKKGTIYFNFTMPYVNLFYTKTTNSMRNAPGFLGAGAGFDFFYKDNQYISIHAGAAIDNEVPFPVGVDQWGKYQRTNSLFLSARHNHATGSFDIGYGFSYSRFNWEETNNADPSFITQKQNTQTLGLSLATQYHINSKFHLGLLYQPALLNLSEGSRLDYQHLLSLELIFKFRIRKGK